MDKGLKQKWIDLSFVFFRSQQYFLWGEFLYLYFLIMIFSLSVKSIFIYSMTFFSLWFINALIFIQRPSKPKDPNFFNPFHPIPNFVEKTIQTADGYTNSSILHQSTHNSPLHTQYKQLYINIPHCIRYFFHCG